MINDKNISHPIYHSIPRDFTLRQLEWICKAFGVDVVFNKGIASIKVGEVKV